MPGPGLERCRIQNLHPNCTNIYVVGQLIARSDVHLFHRNGAAAAATESSEMPTASRGVLKLTLRDAEHAFVNCTVWGTDAYCGDLTHRLQIGDVLCVQRPKVDAVKAQASAYQPLTSSPYQLTVNERQDGASVALATAEDLLVETADDTRSYDTWLHVPVKPTRAALRLTDCNAAQAAGAERFVDLLVVVQRLWPVAALAASGHNRPGERQMRKVDVLDESARGVRLTLWNGGLVKR